MHLQYILNFSNIYALSNVCSGVRILYQIFLEGIDVKEFTEKFEAINGASGKILLELEHTLWGKQVYKYSSIETINTEDKLGVVVKNQQIYVYKKDIKLAKAYDNVYIISDSRLQITIIVNKM